MESSFSGANIGFSNDATVKLFSKSGTTVKLFSEGGIIVNLLSKSGFVWGF